MVERGMWLTAGASAHRKQVHGGVGLLGRLALILAALLVFTTLLAVVLLPRLSDLHVVVVSGGGMGDALPMGSVAWLSPVAAPDVRVGDILLIAEGAPFRHRVVADGSSGDTLELWTEGTRNASRDALPQTLPVEATVERVAFSIPLLGYAPTALQTPLVRAAFGMLLLLTVLWQLGHDLRGSSSAAAGATLPDRLVGRSDA